MSRPQFADTKCAKLRELLADGAWHDQDELADVGGRRYGARLYDIARGLDGGEALKVITEAVGTSEGLYRTRARPYEAGEERPKSKPRLKDLQRELARANARIAQLEAQLAARPRRPATAQPDLFEVAHG